MAQSLSNVLLHIFFSTKNRQLFIDENIESELYAYMTSLFVDKKSYVHKVGGVADHVHLFVTLPRTITISDLLEDTKKHSSRWIKTQGQQYRDFSWQKGFGAFSVSESRHNDVVRYIDNQKVHHQKHTFQDEFRLFLRLNNIPFDERYVWD